MEPYDPREAPRRMDTPPPGEDAPYQPRWVPYAEPPRGPLDLALRRFGFPVAVLGVVSLFGALILLGERPASPRPAGYLPGLAYEDAPEGPFVTIRTHPEGAVVLQEQEFLGVTPVAAHSFLPGQYTVALRFEKEGYEPLDTLVKMPLQGSELMLALTPAQARAEEGFVAEAPEEVLQEPSTPPSTPEPPRMAGVARTERARSAARPRSRDARWAEAPSPPPAAAYASSSQPGAGRVYVTSEPAGATVYLGGRRLGTAPLSITDLAPGDYGVSLQKAGYQTRHLDVAVSPRQTSRVEAHLVPTPAHEMEAGSERVRGTVQVFARVRQQTEAGETILGEPEELFTTTLAPGSRRLRVEHPKWGRKEITVEVQPGGMHRVVVGFDAPSQ